MPRVFLSYARADLEIATRVYDALSLTPNIELWFDHASLFIGELYKPIIEEEIAHADYVVALLSSSYDPLKFQHFELCKAMEEQRRRLAAGITDVFVLPVYLEPVRVNIHGFDDLHRIDWNDNPRAVLGALRTTLLHKFLTREAAERRILCQVHIAQFRGIARNAYFLKVANVAIPPFSITHTWIDVFDRELYFEYPVSRPLPSWALSPGMEWETFLFCEHLPGYPEQSYFEKFRIRLSNGEVYRSYKNNNVAAYGKVGGGPLAPSEPPKMLQLGYHDQDSGAER
ncbi:hypothetical protein GCM10009087_51430 [Sphingomonas oligophenolica]|uniref:Toll/interleukin-1 receptor domain-containing protein n=1 Tax=Sphingomonas oligophenolica TaxID=301154 RepID=A0ABU9Y634_9SPHN